MPLVLLIALILAINPAYANEAPTARIVPYEMPEGLYIPLTVERVIDGDTIVAGGKRIRLWGIDAPEKNEPLYDFTKNFLDEYLLGKRIDCKLIDFDRYKRHVMHCYADVVEINSLLVNLGLAKDYAKYSGGFYHREQENAQSKKLGIWKTQAKEIIQP